MKKKFERSKKKVIRKCFLHMANFSCQICQHLEALNCVLKLQNKEFIYLANALWVNRGTE